jgi:uncharacterized protein (TIGR02145 family)
MHETASHHSCLVLAAILFSMAGAPASVAQDAADSAPSGTLDDYDGNRYRWIRIGKQVWMAENLAVTHFSDGKPIPDGTGVDPASIDQNSRYRFVYDDVPANAAKLGLLYNWAAAMNGEDYDPSRPRQIRGACPAGWHIPHDTEWHELELRLDVPEADLRVFGSRGTDAGGKLKMSGTTLWQPPNLGATNQTGFDAIPAGYCLDGKCDRLGAGTYFWGPEQSDTEFAINHNLRYNESQVGRGQAYKKTAFSIRCIRD